MNDPARVDSRPSKLIQLVPMPPAWGDMFLAVYSDGAVRALLLQMNKEGIIKVRDVPLEVQQ